MRAVDRSTSASARQRWSWWGHIVPPIVVLLAGALAMEMFVRWRQIPVYLLPRPSAVIQSLYTDRADFAAALWTTAQSSLIGFAASAVLGVLGAVAMSVSPLLRRALYPYTVFFQTVPIIAIAPLLILWLEPGLASVATCAFVVSVFPVIANALGGLLATDPALVDLFRLYGAGPVASVMKLRLPSAVPSIFAGLRVAAGLSVIGAVVAELLVGVVGEGEGLGVVVYSGIKNGHTDKVFAAVLVISLFGLALFAAVNLAAWLTLRRWYPTT